MIETELYGLVQETFVADDQCETSESVVRDTTDRRMRISHTLHDQCTHRNSHVFVIHGCRSFAFGQVLQSHGQTDQYVDLVGLLDVDLWIS